MRNNISIIIVNWNAEKYIERCIESLLNQTVLPHEIIVIDNASTDTSVSILRNIKGIKLFALSENKGFAGGNNFGVKKSSPESDWIALINPDAFPEPDWLEKNIRAIHENPLYGSFGSTLINANNNNYLDGIGDYYHFTGRVKRRGYGELKSKYPMKSGEIFSPCAAAAIYRRDLFLDSGGFDEDYFCYVEDVDLGFRFQLMGYKSLLVSNARVHHVGSGTTGGQKSDFSVYHGNRNLVWTYIKNMPGILFWICLPLHILFNVTGIIIYSLSGRVRVITRAKLDALAGLPKMLRKRREIQRIRKVSEVDIWRVMDKRLFPFERRP